MAHIGRTLARNGEVVYAIGVESGVVVLTESCAWTVAGTGPRPETWRYLLEFAGPTGSQTVTLPAASVCHLRYQWDARRPWQGVSPAHGAAATSRLVGGIERQLSNEAANVSGYIMSVPDVGDKGQADEDSTPDPLESS